MRPMRPHRERGVTLIEMMVTVALFVILAMMAMPTWSTWLANQQIRGASEQLLDGIRVAQTEAVKRNQSVRFVLDPDKGWEAQLVSDDSVLRSGLFKEGRGNVTVTSTPVSTTTVVFDGIGRILDKDEKALTTRISFDVTSSTFSTGVRPLRLVIDTAVAGGSAIRTCDPKLTSTDPRACPA